jgi:biotin-dependent carboxylase-like uncharacterized protein
LITEQKASNTATVIASNPQTIVIDRGRKNAMAQGLSESGPMDEHAFLWANRLLGNSNHFDNNCACIEIALGGLALTFNTSCTIAITGAQMQAKINNRLIHNWASHAVKTGDTLSFGFAEHGNYSYLAIAGGFQTDELFQSKSCVLREKLGGHNNGKALAKNNVLYFNEQACLPLKATPFHYQRQYHNNIIELGVITGYQFSKFTEQEQQLFFQQIYRVGHLIDRMGFQLQGTQKFTSQIAMISEPIALGSIQITHSGQPIILMRDRQTIGGYPKLGTIVSSDIEKLAQCKPTQKIKFTAATIAQALQQQKLRAAFFHL